jgi:hypothetical protein
VQANACYLVDELALTAVKALLDSSLAVRHEFFEVNKSFPMIQSTKAASLS